VSAKPAEQIGRSGMGKIEKIVVLGVLFVIVLILVVSLDAGGGKDEVLAQGPQEDGTPIKEAWDNEARELGSRSGDPRLGQRAIQGMEGASVPTAGQVPGGSELEVPDADTSPATPVVALGGDAGLLVAVQQRTPVYVVPDGIPADWDLKTLAGLADHLFDPTHKVYEAKAGDTFEGLAKRYYGDEKFSALLRRANEGRTGLVAGDQLLLPTHDDGASDASGPAPIPEGARTYVALEGESLWKIAKKMYGKGHLWERIWEANRDRLQSADFVPEGIELVIP
jgi:nucleoid-associated protein YgaU